MAHLTNLTPVILVFGESDNDRSALIELIFAARPDISHVNYRKLRTPQVYLRKSELPKTRRKSASEIARLVEAERIRSRVLFVVTHQDCDEIEPAHEVATETALNELTIAGITSLIIATPAFEMETWWMLFPQELKKVRPMWETVDYGTQNVGLIPKTKEKLTADLRPIDSKIRSLCRDYQESDSILIAKKIRETGAILREIKAVSNSFASFLEMVKSIDV